MEQDASARATDHPRSVVPGNPAELGPDMRAEMTVLPADRIARIAWLDRPAGIVAKVAARPTGRLAEFARGRPLGHPLHPALTDLPIGFWTSAFTLDVLGVRRHAAASRRLVGLGVLSAVPTAVAGLADLPSLEPVKRRVAVIHAAANLTATALFARSWSARHRQHLGAGVALGVAASAIATFGGYLGGWMTFGSAPATDDH